MPRDVIVPPLAETEIGGHIRDVVNNRKEVILCLMVIAR